MVADNPDLLIPKRSPSDFKPTNPKDRIATNRLDISTFPQTAILYGALGTQEGLIKYSAYNYRVAGVQVSVYVSAILRHLFKYYNGQWIDPKTKVPHLANLLADAGILVDAHITGKINDDRPPKADITAILDEFEEIIAHLRKTFPKGQGPGRWTELNKGEFKEE